MIGAHRAATTNLCDLLDQHPEVCISHPKEPGFLSWPQRWERGFDWYVERFSHCPDAAIWGECSTTYSQVGVFPSVPRRMAALAPDARIIYSIRHPLDRIRSAWVQYRSQGRLDVPADFNEAVRTVPQLVDASRYRDQIEAYLEFFPAERIRVVVFEEIVAHPVESARDCFEFLGVDPAAVRLRQHVASVNASVTKRADRPPIAMLRRFPGMDRLDPVKRVARRLSHVPGGRTAVALAKRKLRTPIPMPRWDPALRAEVAAELEPQARWALEFAGRPADVWDLGRDG